MQTPAIGLTHDWLTRLIGYSHQAGIAAAGPVVLAPDGRIQHAGIAIPDGIPLHLLHGMRSSMDDFFGYGTSVYNVSAVSGVLATRRDTYQALGGLDPQLRRPRARSTTACAPADAAPAHRDRPRRPPAHRRPRPHRQRPPGHLAPAPQPGPQTHTHDPYYNPNYRTDRGDFELRSRLRRDRRLGAAAPRADPAADLASGGQRRPVYGVPLSALRGRLDDGSARRALGRCIPTGCSAAPADARRRPRVSFPLTLDGDVSVLRAGDAAAP